MKWGVQVLIMGPVTYYLKYIIGISFSLIPHKDIRGLLCTGEVMYEAQCKVQHSEGLYEVKIKIGGVGTIQSGKTHHHTFHFIYYTPLRLHSFQNGSVLLQLINHAIYLHFHKSSSKVWYYFII